MSNDIQSTLMISTEEAQTGSVRTLTLPGDRQLTVTIPAGAYAGQTLVFPGQGLPANGTGPAGALILTLNIRSLEGLQLFGNEDPSETLNAPRRQVAPAPSEQIPPAPFVSPSQGEVFIAPPPPPTAYGPSQATYLTPPHAQATYQGSLSQPGYPTPPVQPNYQGPISQPYPTPPVQPDYQGPLSQPYPTPQYNSTPNWSQPGYMTQAPQPVQKTGSGSKILALVLVVVLVLSGIIGGVVVWANHNAATALQNTNSTATAVVNDASTVQVNGTMKAAAATATSAAQATTTAIAANANPYTSGGTLAFSDTLNTASSNWPQNANCAFNGGNYHVIANKNTVQQCALETNLTLENFVLEMKMTVIQGDVGGFFFRTTSLSTGDNAYSLDIDSKGTYQLLKYSAGSPTSIGSGTASNFKTGYNQTNTIGLVAQGSSITLYLNGQSVQRFTDNSYSSGTLSLIASEYSDHHGTSESAYSNLRIWQL